MAIKIVVWLCVVIAYTVVVIVIYRYLTRRAGTKATYGPVNEIPREPPKLSDAEKELVPFYLKEWQTIIETQMHFNDLIIRFRAIALTAMITLAGASVALQQADKIDRSTSVTVGWFLVALWLTAFVTDFFYYHRLLLGSVAQAMKFDNSDLAKRAGLFGLTTCIKDAVHPPASKYMVGLFYLIPSLPLVYLLSHNIFE